MIVWFDGSVPYFQIHECIYDNRSKTLPHSWAKGGVRVGENSVDEIRVTLTRMRLACNKPILVIKRNKAHEWDGKRPLTPAENP